MSLTYGELFAGYDGLGMGVRSVLGGETAWFAEYDKAPSRILAHHYPGVPNIGDVTTADWASLPPVDVITGGYPCQPFSHAGKRAGANDDRHLWPYVAEAIAVIRPGLCVFENVRGHLSLGFDEVLRDLRQLNYSVRWYTLRAADIGAPHGRARLFIFAEDMNEHRVCGRADRRRGLHRNPRGGRLVPRPAQGGDDGQGPAGATGAPVAAGRVCECRPASGRGDSSDARLDRDGHGCDGHHRAAASASSGEGRGGRLGAGVQGAARETGADQAARSGMDARGAGASGDAAVSDSGGEPTRTRSGAADAAEREAAGGLPLGLVVGAGGRPVRPGRVLGTTADVRSHGCWACVREALVERARGVTADAPTPADADVSGLGGLGRLNACGRDAHGRGRADGPRAPGEPAALLPTPRAQAREHVYAREDHHNNLEEILGYLHEGLDPRPPSLVPCWYCGEPRTLERCDNCDAGQMPGAVMLLPTPAVNDMGAAYTPETWDAWTARMKDAHGNGNGHGKSLAIEAQRLLPTPSASQAGGTAEAHRERKRRSMGRTDPTCTDLGLLVAEVQAWGDYAPAIARWETILGRPAPAPTETGPKGTPRLSPAFTEWMMGLPPGWVTDPAIGISRNDQLKACGNGVVPQQAAAATAAFVHDTAEEAAA